MPALSETPVAPEAPDLRAALEAAALPTVDLADGGRTFLRFAEAGRTIGYAGYELYGRDVLLRSVVVLPAERGKGFGRSVTEATLAHAVAAGARQAYLLTTDAEAFFAHAGFTILDRSLAPEAILATRQATSICSTAALMTRPLARDG